MKALVRKPFHYATRDMLMGAIVELSDAVFAEFKRERLVTEVPPDEPPAPAPIFSTAVPAAAPPVVNADDLHEATAPAKPATAKRKHK